MKNVHIVHDTRDYDDYSADQKRTTTNEWLIFITYILYQTQTHSQINKPNKNIKGCILF